MSERKHRAKHDCTMPAIEAQLMLDWINALLHTKYTMLSQLGNGAAWCQLMKLMYPDSIKAHLINHRCLNEQQMQHNFHMLHCSFRAIGLEWTFPVQPLMQGNCLEIVRTTRFFMQLYVRHCQRRNELLRRCTASVERKTNSGGAPKRKQSFLRRLAVQLGLMSPPSQRSSSARSTGSSRSDTVRSRRGDSSETIYLPQPFQYLFGLSKSSSWETVPMQCSSELRHRRQAPDYLTSQNLLLFFEPVSNSEAELELRLESLRLEKKSLSDLASRASRALRWSPTNRRCYVLPKRVSSLRQSSEFADCLRSMGGLDKQRPHPHKIDELNAAALERQRQQKLYAQQQRLTRSRLEYLLKRQRQHAELEQMVRLYMELRKGQRAMERELQEYRLRKQLERQRN